ncbi:MAG: ABC transporter ATP-binding protein [Ardenticatenaceae bacterium]|nr:ABC transporter ATP-binding protein [Ardenticatenaceae bacterium]
MTDTQPAISIRDLTFTYRIREEPAIHNINLELHPGELMLMVGASGSGKSTIMRAINGLIPRTYRGTMEGSINLFGKDVNEHSMAELSQTVGTLLQDPERQIVTSKVLNEVAFGLENLALPREEILQRVDETLGYLNIMKLRERETFRLSGGEKQIVGVAGVLAMRPRILLLDEPLASLDPASAHESLRIFRELANQGIAVLLVEHRVDDALAIDPDTVVYLENGRIVYSGSPDGLMQTADFHRVKLPASVVMQRAKAEPEPVYKPAVGQVGHLGEELVRFQNVGFRYSNDTSTILHDINFSVRQGDIIALLGPNGAGKTTLVKHVLGLLKPTSGEVRLEGVASKDSTVATAAKTVGYVFQNPSQMLFAPSVQEELAYGPTNLRHDKATMEKNIRWALETIHMSEYRDSPPLALSYGQQKRVSIASILAMRSRILMMDEPTAGQDYWNYRSFMDGILQMPGFDAVLFITHDLDLALTYATRILLLSNGRLAADGPTADVLQDEELLRSCRVLPTSLLRLNLQHLPTTGRFMRAEQLAHAVPNP